MCGISGIYNFNKGKIVEQESLKKMCDVIKYRGPDDEGYYFDKNVGFGHRRLSIIDIEGGHQPMSNEDGSIWIVFNGVIYNYLELRSDLVSQKHMFESHSDTEVIIHLYEQYGFNCVDKLNGMFAFSIWDKKRSTLFLARDRLGIKPLYYYVDKEKFIFASEIKAVLKGDSIKAQLNPKGLRDYLTFQFYLEDKTLFKGINKLLPGYRIIISGKDVKIEKYWDLDFNIDTRHDEDYFRDKLLMLLEDSIRLCLRSDVPVGAHLSGGIDSSSVVSIASTFLNAPLKTFTGAFKEGKEFDESDYARMVAEVNNTCHHEIFLTPKDFTKSFFELIYFLDNPIAGPGVFPQYFVSKLASKNVKVVLGGQGGDEVFGGYIRYLIAYLEESLLGAVCETHKDKPFVVTFDSILPNLPQLKGYSPLLQYFWQDGLFEDMDRRYFRLIRKDIGISDFIAKDIFNGNDNYCFSEEFRNIFNRPGLESLINKMTHFDIKTLLPALLHVEDRTSMSVSLESRVPLLDHRIVELAASMPPTIKFKGGQTKYIFRQAVKNIIPQSIVSRKDKMGFPVPLFKWYKKELRNFVKEILLDRKTKKRGIFNDRKIENYLEYEQPYGRTIWGLLCLEVWFRTFID